MNKGDILAVDDTPASLKLLTDILKTEGYTVRSALSGELALTAAAMRAPELVLLDVNMPGLNGFEVCRRLKDRPETCETPIIFVSALSETVEKVKGFEFGAVDYVTKPFQRDELLARVHTHLELHRLRHRLEEMVQERTAALRASQTKLRSTLINAIEVLAATTEMRDPYTAGHQRRTAKIARMIGRELRLPEEKLMGLCLAGAVHDVGKIKVPMEILNRPGRLSETEFLLIKEHVRAGHDILKAIDFPWPIADIILQHHERLDGSGYPQALRGNEILFEAKILAVADVMESIMSHRPYRAALGVEAGIAEIVEKRGKAFDEQVVDACVRLFREKRWSPELHG